LCFVFSLSFFCFGDLKIETVENQKKATVYCDKCGTSKDFFFNSNATKEYICQNVYLIHDNLINNWETRYLKDINIQIELPAPFEKEERKDYTQKPDNPIDAKYWAPYIRYTFKKVDNGNSVYIFNPIQIEIECWFNNNEKNLKDGGILIKSCIMNG
jgi:hypothetical protein